jgi:hypothetical protein
MGLVHKLVIRPGAVLRFFPLRKVALPVGIPICNNGWLIHYYIQAMFNDHYRAVCGLVVVRGR